MKANAWPPDALPWTEALEQQLKRQQHLQRMPHALCIEGPAGVGKAVVAERLVGLLLCSAEIGERPCGQCAECQLLQAGTHPDRIQVVPDTATGKTISVEAVRRLIERISMRPQRQGAQVAVIVPADALNAAAANALLKTLEEPAPDSHLLLLASDPTRLPITVLSRCLRLPVPAPDVLQALDWLTPLTDRAEVGLALELADGRPLLALEALQGQRWQIWNQSLQRIVPLSKGEAGVAETALALARTPQESLEVIQRVLESALDLTLGGSKFTHLREYLHLTSQVQGSTLQAAWLDCKRMRIEMGSGLRDDFALAAILEQCVRALCWPASRKSVLAPRREYYR